VRNGSNDNPLKERSIHGSDIPTEEKQPREPNAGLLELCSNGVDGISNYYR
jgi:hypothetical protein